MRIQSGTDADAKLQAPALRAFLEGFIDYAGIYPPAKLPLSKAVENYRQYSACEFAWMLRYFVLGKSELSQLNGEFDSRFSLLADENNARAGAIESKQPVAADKAVYCEIPAWDLASLSKIKESSNYAKIRMGGLSADAFPAPSDVAQFILACARLHLPFKATAGLHHAVAGNYPVCYEPDSANANMHGFLNLLFAAGFAFVGKDDLLEPVLLETDGASFSFGEKASWRGNEISLSEIKEMRRNLLHSIGSCSFEEPLVELCGLGLLIVSAK